MWHGKMGLLAERYLKDAIRYNSYFGLVRADAKRIPFKTKSFDCVVAVELIEHLQKPDGYTFLEETKRIAKRRIVLSTPSGYFKSLCDTDEEVHRSGWNKSELEKSGFCCSTFKGELYTWLLCILNLEKSLNRSWSLQKELVSNL